MRRIAISLMLLVLVAGFAVAQQATFESVRGKVEVRVPGGTWQAAQSGQTVPVNSTVSTGFNSRAELSLGRSSLVVEPLSRMTLAELAEREGTVSTDVRLQVGRARAEVRSAQGVRTNFRMRGPISTASVRGTQFDFDGFLLFVGENEVELQNLLEQYRTVLEGQSASTDGYSYPENPERRFIANSTTDTQPRVLVGNLPQGRRGSGGGDGFGRIIVTIEE